MNYKSVSVQCSLLDLKCLTVPSIYHISPAQNKHFSLKKSPKITKLLDTG
jgi:hypothetical protein